VLHMSVGDVGRYGLPAPDHALFASHPIINSQLPYFVGHGRIVPKPNIAELAGGEVRFADGSAEAIDLIVYATGYKISFPFLDREHLNWQDGRPGLYLNVFHPRYDNLFVIGLIQPDSGQFGLVDYQSRMVARFVAAARAKAPAAERFRRAKARGEEKRKTRYLDTPRNLLEVEHFSYRRQMQRELDRLRAA
jgi:Flavin-binding monooxygenase-like